MLNHVVPFITCVVVVVNDDDDDDRMMMMHFLMSILCAFVVLKTHRSCCHQCEM